MPEIVKTDGGQRRPGQRDPDRVDAGAVFPRDPLHTPPRSAAAPQSGVPVDEQVEPLGDIGRFQRLAVFVGEHTTTVRPRLTPRQPFCPLGRAPRPAHGRGGLIDNDDAVRLLRLHRAERVVGLGLTDVDPPGIETDIRPCQAHELPAAQPPERGQMPQRIQPVMLDDIEERTALGGRPHHHLRGDLPGLLPVGGALRRPQQRPGAALAPTALRRQHAVRRIHVDDFRDCHRVVERAGQHGVDAPDSGFGQGSRRDTPAALGRAGGEQAPQQLGRLALALAPVDLPHGRVQVADVGVTEFD